MSNKLGPLDVICDAPPYCIVRACHLIGLQAPEDVRWLRLSHFLRENAGEEQGGSFFHKLLGTQGRMKDGSCSCGQALPALEKYVFTLLHHGDLYYLLGQCPRCRTIFWEED